MTQNHNLHTEILTEVCVSLNLAGSAKNVLSVCVLTVKAVQILSLQQCQSTLALYFFIILHIYASHLADGGQAIYVPCKSVTTIYTCTGQK